MKGQTKRHSVFEAITNIAIGYWIALAGQLIIFPLAGMEVKLHQNLYIGAFFTVLSFLRSYAIRRMWNWIHLRQSKVL